MEVRYNVTGERRKELAQVISKITGAKAEYQYMPTCAYKIDFFTLTKDGTLEFSDSSDSKIVNQVLDGIAGAGFGSEATEKAKAAATEEKEDNDTDEGNSDEPISLMISVPKDKVNVDNLTKLLKVKGDLIKKALGIDDLQIEVDDESVSFPWFSEIPDAESFTAYLHLITAMCQLSCEQTRINGSLKPVENERYAFRCFLLRLGFIGPEYKKQRKILLQNLSGSNAYRDRSRKRDGVFEA